ncbi:MAG: gas vesicle protein [Nocardioidaceae bacterium]|nr:gas vesicle protein [Nocardioidaceae bacterium]
MAELSLAEIGRRVLGEVEALSGCPVEGMTAIRADDDGWVAMVDVLELERVPETTDVLASYEVNVDGDGAVTGYRRVRRFLRSQVEER